MAAMDIHLPQNWLRAVAAGAEAAILSWLVAILGALVTYVATAAAPGLGEATWSSTAAIGTGWWTLAFGGRVPLEEGVVTLAPLGITALALVLLRGAQRRLGVDTPAGVALGAGAFAVSVALLGLVAGRGSGLHVAGALAVGALAGLWTLSRRQESLPGAVRAALAGIAPAVRVGLDAARVALVAVLGVGLALVALAVVAGWDQVVAVHDSLRPDVASATVLALAQAAYLPNLALWALAWLGGPGFAVGEGTTFSALGTTVELLPAIPVLGALPAPGTALPWALAVPALLGALVGGWRGRGLTTGRSAALAAGTLLASSWTALAILGTVASGSIGPGRMAATGLHGPLVAIVLAGGMAGGYALVLLARLPATRARVRAVAAGLRGRDADGPTSPQAAGSVPSSGTAPTPAAASTPPTALSLATAATAATAPTALSPGEAAEPLR